MSCSGCGNGCGGCKMYPEMEKTSTERLVAPQKSVYEGSEMGVGAEEEGCKCGDSCTCNPCNFK